MLICILDCIHVSDVHGNKAPSYLWMLIISSRSRFSSSAVRGNSGCGWILFVARRYVSKTSHGDRTTSGHILQIHCNELPVPNWQFAVLVVPKKWQDRRMSVFYSIRPHSPPVSRSNIMINLGICDFWSSFLRNIGIIVDEDSRTPDMCSVFTGSPSAITFVPVCNEKHREPRRCSPSAR